MSAVLGKKTSAIFILFVLVISLFSLVFISPPQTVNADFLSGTYYGYGDSIMSPGFTSPAEHCFVNYMEERYGTELTDNANNWNGHSMTSVWGLANFYRMVEPENYTVEMFGVNDCKTTNWVSAIDIAQNKMAMYNLSVENSSEERYMPCITVLADPAGESGLRPWNYQCDAINSTENHFIRYSIKFAPMYDCLDSIPYNGRRDEWFDGGNYNDGYVHPDAYAHEYIMANFLWFFINGDDYTETYHAGNDTITIQANYNETIYVYPRTDWDVNDVILTCETNSSTMSFDTGFDIAGDTTIQFDILNGSFYTLTHPNIAWRYINSGTNNSNTTLQTRSFDFTNINETLYYNIEISNSSDFSSIYINITDVNETNYGVNYYEYNSSGVSYVHFNYTSDVDWGYKYYRVRAYRYE